MLTKKKLISVAKRAITATVCFGMAAFMFANMSLTGLAVTKGKVIANAAKVRAEANTTSAQVGSVPKDGEVIINGEVTGSDGKTWYKVSFDTDKTGYIRSDLLTKTEVADSDNTQGQESTLAPGVTAVNPVNAKVSGAQVRVRNSASTAGDIVTTLEKDAVVTVIGTATDSTGKIWYQITYNNSVNGFVRNDFVTLQGDLTAPVEQPADTPVEDPVTDPVEETPAQETVVEKKAMETQLENDIWYLIDNNQGMKYSIPELFDAAQKNADLYNESLKTMKKMKMWIGILLAITFVAVVGATMIIMKFKDLKDAVDFGKTEREVLEKRMNQRPKNRMPRPEGERSDKQQAVAKTGQQKAVNPQKRTVTDVSGKPVNQGKPAANVQTRPAAKPAEKERVQFNEQMKDKVSEKPVAPKAAEEVKEAVKEAPKKPEAQKSVAPQEKAPEKPKPQAKPKNFLEDDDDFEFEFLNWDGDK